MRLWEKERGRRISLTCPLPTPCFQPLSLVAPYLPRSSGRVAGQAVISGRLLGYSEILYHRDDALLYIAYVMLI